MPRLDVIQPGYSFSSELGKALGRAGEGFSQGIQESFKDFYRKKDNISKNFGTFQSSWRASLKDEKAFDAYGRKEREDAEKYGLKLVEEGADPHLAKFEAYKYLTDKDYRNAISGIREQKEEALPKEESLNESLKRRNEEVLASERTKQFGGLTKPLEAMTPAEITQLPTDFVKSLPMEQQRIIGQKIAQGAREGVGLAYAKGLDPTGLIRGGERKFNEAGFQSGIPQANEFNQGALTAANVAGNVVKDIGLLNLAGIATPGTPAGALKGAAGFGALKGAEFAAREGIGEGRTPQMSEFAQRVGEEGALYLGAELIAPLLNIVERIPGLKRTVQTAAKAGGVEEKAIIEEAANNLARRGVNVMKAAEGDAATINELQKETNRVAKSFSEAEKFNQKEVEKIRQEVAKKLPESPLEEYYAPKKEVKHRPETIAKETERLRQVNADLALANRHLKSTQRGVLEGENALRGAKAEGAPPEVIQRIESMVKSNRLQHEKTLNEIRNLEFKKKYGYVPKSSEEISQQIEKSFEEMRGLIKNPNAEKLQKMTEAIERDKKVIDQTQKLIARGEIPGKPVYDEFIKIHEHYNKAYGDLAKEMKDFIKENAKIKAKAAEVKRAQELLHHVEQMKAAGEAKVLKQVDKRRVMQKLDKPSGAFFKQQLKDLRKDVEAFQKDFFQYGKLQDINTQKVSEAAKKSIPKEKMAPKVELKSAEEAAQAASKAAKNPTAENTAKIDEAIGVPKGRTEGVIEQLKADAMKLGKEAKSGVVDPKKIDELSSKVMQKLKFHGRRAAKGIMNGLIIGTIQGLIEEATGYKTPQSILSLIGGKGLAGRGSSFGIASLVQAQVRKGFDHLHAEELKKLRNTEKFNERRKELEEKFSPSRANRIVRMSAT